MNQTEQDLKLNLSDERQVTSEHATRSLPMVICTSNDLDTLLQASRTRRRLPQGHFTFAISDFNEQERLIIQRKLNTYAHACGCTEGGIFAITALAVAIIYSIFNVLQGAWLDLIAIWLVGLVLIPLCAGVGKLLGQFVARLRFRRICIRLLRSLQPEVLLA